MSLITLRGGSNLVSRLPWVFSVRFGALLSLVGPHGVLSVFLSDHRCLSFRDTMDSVKQSAALCLLRLYRTSPDLVPMGDWTSRVVHLLNDQHLVNTCGVVASLTSLSNCFWNSHYESS